jgi:hypothetical protein
MKFLYHANFCAFHLLEVLICDIKLIGHNIHLAYLYRNRDRRLQRIAELERQLSHA